MITDQLHLIRVAKTEPAPCPQQGGVPALGIGRDAGSATPAWALLAVFGAAVCWSTSGLWIALVVQRSGVSAAGLAFWRDLATFAALGIALGVFSPSLLRVRRRDLPWLVAMGVISIGLFHVLWNLSLQRNGVSLATVISYNSIIIVPLLAWLLWREPLTWAKVVAAILALVGVALVAGLSAGGNVHLTTTGLMLGLATALAYGSLSIFGKRLTGDYSPWVVLCYAFGFAALVLFGGQLAAGRLESLPSTAWLPFAGLVMVSTLGGFGLYTVGLRHLQAGVAAIVAASEVLFAAVLAYFILGERLGAWQAVGSLLILVGVVVLAVGRSNQGRRIEV